MNHGLGTRPGVTAYRGHIINPCDSDSFTDTVDGALVVDERGIIVFVGAWGEFLATRTEPARVLDYGKRLIVPGFVDLHIHLVQIAQTGRAGDSLLGWLDKYIFPAEARFAEREHAAKLADWFFHELARNGTTLSAVFTSIHKEACDLAFQTAADLGCRVIMGKVLMDRNSPESLTEDTSRSLEESEELCQRWHGHDDGRLLYAFTPRFAPTSSPNQLTGAAELWRRYPGTYMQTHLSENVDEISWVKELFPSSKSYFDVYASHGLEGRNSLFAHAIHLEAQEIEGLKSSESAVVHCPCSNFFLKSGVFPLGKIRGAGVKMGLGSDMAAGPEMSMFKVMKDAAYVQPNLWLSPRELFFWATLGGAQAANLDHRIGSFAEGKEADFVVLDPTIKTSVPFDILEQPVDDILSSLVYVGDDRMVVATYVRGRAIYQLDEVHERTSPRGERVGLEV